VAALAVVACAEVRDGERVVHAERSAHQTIVVTDSATRRCLRFGDPTDTRLTQSCQLIGQPDHLAFEYTRAMVAVLLLWQPAPERVLLIGVGGGSMPRAIAHVRPGITVDAVDIDDAVLRVAERYFGLKAGPRLRLHHADGRAFVAQALARGETYDAILLDAFDAEGIPPGLFDEAFLRDVRALLAPAGVLLANTVASTANHAAELAAAEKVFGRFHTIRGVASSNRLLVATVTPAQLPEAAHLLEAVPAQRAALERLGIEEAWVRELQFVAAPAWPGRARAATGLAPQFGG
jgi:spermidine synthase